MKKPRPPSTLSITQLRNAVFPIRVQTKGGSCYKVSMVDKKFHVYQECNGSTFVAHTLLEAKYFMGCST